MPNCQPARRPRTRRTADPQSNCATTKHSANAGKSATPPWTPNTPSSTRSRTRGDNHQPTSGPANHSPLSRLVGPLFLPPGRSWLASAHQVRPTDSHLRRLSTAHVARSGCLRDFSVLPANPSSRPLAPNPCPHEPAPGRCHCHAGRRGAVRDLHPRRARACHRCPHRTTNRSLVPDRAIHRLILRPRGQSAAKRGLAAHSDVRWVCAGAPGATGGLPTWRRAPVP